MKLFYYRDERGNFGDDLNPWVFYQYAPNVFNGEGDHLVGIGTLINSRAPAQGKKHVFGSGVGYHQAAKINDDWHFLFVRGPLSAQALKLPEDKGVTDPAILLADMVGRCEQRNLISFMPHQVSAMNGDWKGICEQLGITYLDPAGEIHENLHLINRSKLVLADAMHAAIVADAMRVPWVPVKAYGHILDFKWQDWCQSLGMNYQPISVPEYWTLEERDDSSTRFKSSVKRSLMRMGFSGAGWTQPPPVSNRALVQDQVLSVMQGLARGDVQYLSDDAWHQRQLQRVLTHMDDLVRRGP
jgi:succinoglycan biosynthesis protein ExoV